MRTSGPLRKNDPNNWRKKNEQMERGNQQAVTVESPLWHWHAGRGGSRKMLLLQCAELCTTNRKTCSEMPQAMI